MYNAVSIPTDRRDISSLADFAEIECLRREGAVSQRTLVRAMSVTEDSDETDSGAVDSNQDKTDAAIEAAFSLIDARKEELGSSYPFQTAKEGNTLIFAEACSSRNLVIYSYLLLTSRLNMGTGEKSFRSRNGVNATETFEQLSACVARRYYGPQSKSFVFGTGGEASSFKGKLTQLCELLGEGGGPQESVNSRRQDARLDVVAWIPFKDQKPGKLIALGQCKTGRSYNFESDRFDPRAFAHSYLKDGGFAVMPVPMFFVAASEETEEFGHYSSHAGIIFDRNRILSLSEGVDGILFQEIQKWSSACFMELDIPITPFFTDKEMD